MQQPAQKSTPKITASVFQNFAKTTTLTTCAARVADLRQHLKTQKLDGFLIPRADCFQNEYVRPCDDRLAFISSFTGSAGLAVVLAKRALIFVDGRYHEQVKHETDLAVFEPHDSVSEPPEIFLVALLKPKSVIGYDPWLFTPTQLARFEKAFTQKNIVLQAVKKNLIDLIWHDRPVPKLVAAHQHPAKYAGATVTQKLTATRDALSKQGACHGLVITDPHALCWLFNLRGGDIAHTPLVLGFALVPLKGKPILYVNIAKFPKGLLTKLKTNLILKTEDVILDDLIKFGKAKQTLVFDTATVPSLFTQTFEHAGGTAHIGLDPTSLLKAAKNAAELDGMREAHVLDGTALVNFLHWFDEAASKNPQLTEIDATIKLEQYRLATKRLKDLSFPAITGAGANAALPHYHVTTKTNRKLGQGIFLVDSGGQYDCGTTDITRTVCVGKPTPAMMEAFTRVLIGHIRLTQAVFPKGTNGAQLDALARSALWDAGLDFNHGTGHGVGACLSVQEGPQRIAKTGSVALVPGMIVSNEPGFYYARQFGIRIENLLVVTTQKTRAKSNGLKAMQKDMLCFETISFAPIDTRLVNVPLLSARELAWLNSYHAQVYKTLAPHLEAKPRAWLKRATQTIKI